HQDKRSVISRPIKGSKRNELVFLLNWHTLTFREFPKRQSEIPASMSTQGIERGKFKTVQELPRVEIGPLRLRILDPVAHFSRRRRRISEDEMPPSFLWRDLDRSMMARNLSLVLRETVSVPRLGTGTTAAIGFPFFMTTIGSFFAFCAYSDSGAEA